MSETYKQPIKEYSRLLIWQNAVVSLTTNRQKNQILNYKYIQRLWDFVFEETLFKHKLLDNADEGVLDDWRIFAKNVYGKKSPEQLKVAYLCGPEPENDLDILVNLGVRIENVYAFESDKTYFKEAIESIRHRFPTLKIYNGKIEDFLTSTPIKFDIIYLDFTAPIFSNASKPYATINTIFDYQALDELGILITNSCFPDKTEENMQFLESYFLNQEFCESNVFKEDAEDEDRSNYNPHVSENGYYKRSQIRKIIDQNFWHAYSAFATHYPIEYASLVQPSLRVLKNPISNKRLFNITTEKIDELLNNFLSDEDNFIEQTRYPLYFFLNSLNELQSKLSTSWLTYFRTNEIGTKYSRETAIKHLYMFRDSAYEDVFLDLLSATLKEALPKIREAIPDRRGGLFCDVPMIHLWLELAVNQLGYPYHINVSNQHRYYYKAKEREMCIDIFTFDRCRALYDWLPMIEYYEQDLSNIERQMLSRICIDAIGKQSFQIIDKLYYGSAIVGVNEKKWSENHSFRERLNVEDEAYDFMPNFEDES